MLKYCSTWDPCQSCQNHHAGLIWKRRVCSKIDAVSPQPLTFFSAMCWDQIASVTVLWRNAGDGSKNMSLLQDETMKYAGNKLHFERRGRVDFPESPRILQYCTLCWSRVNCHQGTVLQMHDIRLCYHCTWEQPKPMTGCSCQKQNTNRLAMTLWCSGFTIHQRNLELWMCKHSHIYENLYASALVSFPSVVIDTPFSLAFSCVSLYIYWYTIFAGLIHFPFQAGETVSFFTLSQKNHFAKGQPQKIETVKRCLLLVCILQPCHLVLGHSLSKNMVQTGILP